MIPLMRSLLSFLLLIFPGPAALDKITAYVSGTVEFRCRLPKDKIDKFTELAISWEKHPMEGQSSNIVVAELFKNKTKKDHVSESYKNRKIEFIGYGDLRLYDIILDDAGGYGCYAREQMSEHTLNVLANFSVPQINKSNLTVVPKGSDVTLHCSSRDGFPKPDGILWTVSDENRTQSHHEFCNLESRPSCNIKNNSQIFTISSELNVMVGSNISVTCTVLAHHNFSSTSVHIGVEIEKPPIKENGHLKYILPCGFLIAFTIIACIAYFCYKKNGKTCKLRPSQNKRTMATNRDIQQSEETTVFI